MKDEKYIEVVSSKLIFRIAAWIGIIIIAALIVATFITGIRGSKYFMGFLVLSIIVPVLLYVALWIGKVLFVTNNDNDRADDEDRINSDSSDSK